MKINYSLACPTREQVSAMSDIEAIQAAIAAWDACDYESALAFAGKRCIDEVWVNGPHVYARSYAEPRGGNSPRLVPCTVNLCGSARACALAAHILAVGLTN